jgi:hypothetical protein
LIVTNPPQQPAPQAAKRVRTEVALPLRVNPRIISQLKKARFVQNRVVEEKTSKEVADLRGSE